MRLLYLSPAGSVGGAERVLLTLLGGLRRARPTWTLGLVVAGDGPLADEARQLGVETFVLPFPRAFAASGDAGLSGPRSWLRLASKGVFGSFAIAGYVRALRRAVTAFEPDVVHSNGFKMHILGAIARPTAPLIWHVHDYLSARRVASNLVRRLRSRCSMVVAVSNDVAADLRRELGPDSDIRTVPNAIDTSRYSPAGPHLDLDALASLPHVDGHIVRIGLVATFARWKGHILFLEAIKTLTPRHAVRAYIVGGPVYETEGSQFTVEELRDEIARMGLTGTVGLTGYVGDVSAAMRSLDVVVHASTSPEPFGLVVAEAMTTGRAVVVSGSGGVLELIRPEEDALVFTAGGVPSLATQLDRLLTDAGLRRRLGLTARQAALERFASARFVNDMLDVYSTFSRRAAA